MSEIIDEGLLYRLKHMAHFEPSDIRSLIEAVERGFRKEREWRREESDLLSGHILGNALFVTKDGLKCMERISISAESLRAPRAYRRLIARTPKIGRVQWEQVPLVALEACEERTYELQGFATVAGRRVLKYVEV
jgi:hypothetical protein